MASETLTGHGRMIDGRRTLRQRECACGEQVDYETPSGDVVCLECAPTALAGDETWDDLRALDGDERWVVDGDADA